MDCRCLRACLSCSVEPVIVKRQFSVRPFTLSDEVGIQRLWSSVASFDGSVAARTVMEMTALLAHPAHRQGAQWRVAVAGNDVIVGALEIVGAVRSEVVLAVNPAWRRVGIGHALLETAPRDRSLHATTRASAQGSAELLRSMGFVERSREARMRRKASGMRPLPVADSAFVDIDAERDVPRLRAALAAVFGAVAETDAGLMKAWLARPGCRALYLVGDQGDVGVCLVAGSEHARKSERAPSGEAAIGVVEWVGLAKSARGQGLSRPLVRAGLVQLCAAGYLELEVTADRRQERAIALYEAEGFSIVDEDVHWLREAPAG